MISLFAFLVFFIVTIGTAWKNEQGKYVFYDWLINADVILIVISGLALLFFVVVLIVFFVSKKHVVEDSAKPSEETEDKLLCSFEEKELVSFSTRVEMLVFGNVGSFVAMICVVFFAISISVLAYFFLDKVAFAILLSLGLLLFLFLVFSFVINPFLAYQKEKKNGPSSFSKINIFNSKIEFSFETKSNEENVKNVTLNLVFSSSEKAKETKDGYFFLGCGKSKIVFYIGKNSIKDESVQKYLSEKVVSISKQ